MHRIQRIAVRHVQGTRRVCEIRVAGRDGQFPFDDLVGFSDGLQDMLLATERLVPRGVVRPTDRSRMQLEGLRVQDAAEYNRNLYSGREVRERRAEGEKICGGDWYAEIAINGTDSDVSFTTVVDLFTAVQQIISRELALAGQIVTHIPVEVARG